MFQCSVVCHANLLKSWLKACYTSRFVHSQFQTGLCCKARHSARAAGVAPSKELALAGHVSSLATKGRLGESWEGEVRFVF